MASDFLAPKNSPRSSRKQTSWIFHEERKQRARIIWPRCDERAVEIDRLLGHTIVLNLPPRNGDILLVLSLLFICPFSGCFRQTRWEKEVLEHVLVPEIDCFAVFWWKWDVLHHVRCDKNRFLLWRILISIVTGNVSSYENWRGRKKWRPSKQC